MGVVDQVERVYQKYLFQRKVSLRSYNRGWGQLGRTAVSLFSEGMNLLSE